MYQKWSFLRGVKHEEDGTDHVGDAERCGLDLEKEERLEYHAITLRNASYLSKHQYRKAMNNLCAGERNMAPVSVFGGSDNVLRRDLLASIDSPLNVRSMAFMRA